MRVALLSQNISVFFIITPLLMGFFSFLFKGNYEKVVQKVYLGLAISLFCISVWSIFYFDLFSGKSILSVVGGWSKAIGIELKFNLKNVLVVSSLILIFVVFLATNLNGDVNYRFRGFACVMLCGANGLALTNDVFNTYVFFEIVCITTYIVYAYGEKKEGIKNAYNYMILSSFAGVVFLMVLCFLYQITGNLNVDLIHQIIINAKGNKTIDACFVLFILVMIIKLGVYPFHGIVSGIYKNLSVNFLIIVAGISSIIYPVFILKFIADLFGVEFFLRNEYLCVLLKVIGGVGFVFFNIVALLTTSFLHFIVYLSFVQTSLFVFCLPYIASSSVLNGVYFAIIANSILKVCLLGLVYKIFSSVSIDDIKKTSIKLISSNKIKYLIVLSLFFMSGMPVSLVFISKIYILLGVLNSAGIILWVLFLISGFVIEMFSCFSVIREILSQKTENSLLYNISLSKTFSIITFLAITIVVVSSVMCYYVR